MKFYPRAHENKVRSNDPSIRIPHRAFFKAAVRGFVLLQILFLALFSYLFGSLFEQSVHTHNMKVLFVDYDQSSIGNAIRSSYQGLKGNTFPSLIEKPPSQFTTPDDLRNEVCKVRYWAALYTSPGASDRLKAA